VINETYLIYRFAINFKASNDDIYFHFNARPREARVVRNSFVGSWGREEKDCPQGFPFYPSQYFDASFVCMEDKFSVSTTRSMLLYSYM
jgi:hypothetical protein